VGLLFEQLPRQRTKFRIVPNDSLKDLTRRAEDAAKRLELMVASMHDLPPATPKTPPPQTGPVFSRHSGGAG
jgi:hypothetical protein